MAIALRALERITPTERVHVVRDGQEALEFLRIGADGPLGRAPRRRSTTG